LLEHNLAFNIAWAHIQAMYKIPKQPFSLFSPGDQVMFTSLLLDTKAWFDSIHSTIRFVLPVKTLPNFYDNTMILLIIATAIFVEGKEDI